MKYIAQILSFSLALILAITFTTPVFADTNPPEDTAHAYHFRTAKEYDAVSYTHLDVYKRQASYSAGPLRPFGVQLSHS